MPLYFVHMVVVYWCDCNNNCSVAQHNDETHWNQRESLWPMTRSLFYEIRARKCFESWLILCCVFSVLFYYFNYSRVFSSIVVCNYLSEKLIWAFSTNSLRISGINSFKLFIYKLLSRTTFSFHNEREAYEQPRWWVSAPASPPVSDHHKVCCLSLGVK